MQNERTKVAVAPESPNEIVLDVSIPRSAADYYHVEESFAALEEDLRLRWPVQSVRDSNRRRNPADLRNWVIPIAISLASPLLKPMGEKLRDEVFDWFHKRFKSKAKRPGIRRRVARALFRRKKKAGPPKRRRYRSGKRTGDKR